MGHTRWTRRSDTILALLGLAQVEIDVAKQHRATLCEHVPRARSLRITRKVEHELLKLNIGPETMMSIAEHLAELNAKLHGEDDADAHEALKAYDRERKAKSRDEDRAAYNEKQKLLMRERRAREKEQAERRSNAGKIAAQARWGAKSPPGA